MPVSGGERHGALTAALLGGALVAGWVVHDLIVYLGSGDPSLAATLLAPSLALIALGAVCGALLLPRRWALLLALAVPVAVWLAPGLVPIYWSEQRTQLVRALVSLLVAGAAGWLLVQHTRVGSLRAGLSLGALASLATALWTVELSTHSLGLAGAAALLLAVGFSRGQLVRVALSCVALAVALVPPALQALEQGPLRRANLPRSSADLTTSPSTSPPTSPNRATNLVLVVLDTVRADHLAPYGYERATTPALDELVRERGIQYTAARSTSSWTLPSHASMFTGLLPSEHGATHPRGAEVEATLSHAAAPAQKLRDDVPTLASLLRDSGYRTGAVMANAAYLLPRFGLDRGFEHYDARPGGLVGNYYPLAQLAWARVRAGRQVYRDARQITDLALDWLERAPGERPFFLTVNYMDAHAPYLPPAPHDEAFGEARVAEPWLLRKRDRTLLYDRSLLFLDAQLERLLAAVDLERTVVIVTSDHGEALGNHGYWMHSWTLYDEVVRVPLYVFRPGGTSAVNSEPVSGADVFRIALREVGLPQEQLDSELHPFGEWFQLEHTPDAEVLTDKHVARDLLAWIEDGRKVIVSSTGEVEVYDLTADPGERSPLELDDAEVAAARARAETWWLEHPSLDTGSTGELDEDELDRLRKLGYMGGDS